MEMSATSSEILQRTGLVNGNALLGLYLKGFRFQSVPKHRLP